MLPSHKRHNALAHRPARVLLPVLRCRYLWLAVQHPPWSPAEHRRFMPAFKQAARTLLLAAHRTGSVGGSGSGSNSRSDGGLSGEGKAKPRSSQPLLAALPPDVLLRILGMAAYPLSAWAPLLTAAGAGGGGS